MNNEVDWGGGGGQFVPSHGEILTAGVAMLISKELNVNMIQGSSNLPHSCRV